MCVVSALGGHCHLRGIHSSSVLPLLRRIARTDGVGAQSLLGGQGISLELLHRFIPILFLFAEQKKCIILTNPSK